jgi:two-component system sensor histidine kinase KdpD
MDTEAIIRRRPAVCLVDELAHTNSPGSEREKRYEDVQAIRDAGINVVSTLNVQHLESLNDTVEALTGIRVRETVPDRVVDEADELILIDLSPEGARARMEHGHIYPPEQARAALQNFFRPENLAQLREIALRRTAEEVDEQINEYMRETAIKNLEYDEHVLVLIDDRPESRTLIRRGWRLAQGLRADLIVAYFNRELDDARHGTLSGRWNLRRTSTRTSTASMRRLMSRWRSRPSSNPRAPTTSCCRSSLFRAWPACDGRHWPNN